jgi:hypothetical protein
LLGGGLGKLVSHQTYNNPIISPVKQRAETPFRELVNVEHDNPTFAQPRKSEKKLSRSGSRSTYVYVPALKMLKGK